MPSACSRYRDRVCCYNDDIQGTAGIALAGLVNALKVTGGKLKDQRILFLGAGSAGIGIANLIASAMTLEGISLKEAQAQISLFDVNGLLEPTRKDLLDFQLPYAYPHAPTKDFVAAIGSLKPNAIIGVSTVGRAFTQQVVEAMCQINERPIIFALSNPTDHAECFCRAGVQMVKRQGGLRCWCAVPAGPVREADPAARSGEQLLCLPGYWDGNLRDSSQASH